MASLRSCPPLLLARAPMLIILISCTGMASTSRPLTIEEANHHILRGIVVGSGEVSCSDPV